MPSRGRIRKSSSGGEPMYTGTMIDDLIAMVARAEEQAHQPEASALPEPLELTGPVYAQYYEPPYVASMVGAA